MTDDEKTVARMLINPASVVDIAGLYFASHEPMIARDDWLLLNTRLIESMSAQEWLTELLDTLSSSDEESFAMTCSPYHVIELAPELKSKKPSTDKQAWMAANVKIINELGAYQWLEELLNVLENADLA